MSSTNSVPDAVKPEPSLNLDDKLPPKTEPVNPSAGVSVFNAEDFLKGYKKRRASAKGNITRLIKTLKKNINFRVQKSW